MDAIRDFLTDLPMPFGPIVTGLLPIIAVAGLVLAAWGYRKGRRLAAAVGVLIGLVGLTGMAAFLLAT